MTSQEHAPELWVEEIALDALSSDPMAWLHAFADLPGVVFLDSARPGSDLGRYSFLAADPIHLIAAKNGVVTVDGEPQSGDPFAMTQALLNRYRLPHRPD